MTFHADQSWFTETTGDDQKFLHDPTRRTHSHFSYVVGKLQPVLQVSKEIDSKGLNKTVNEWIAMCKYVLRKWNNLDVNRFIG